MIFSLNDVLKVSFDHLLRLYGIVYLFLFSGGVATGFKNVVRFIINITAIIKKVTAKGAFFPFFS